MEIHDLVMARDIQKRPRPLIQHIGLNRTVTEQPDPAFQMLPLFAQRCKLPGQFGTLQVQRDGRVNTVITVP